MAYRSTRFVFDKPQKANGRAHATPFNRFAPFVLLAALVFLLAATIPLTAHADPTYYDPSNGQPANGLLTSVAYKNNGGHWFVQEGNNVYEGTQDTTTGAITRGALVSATGIPATGPGSINNGIGGGGGIAAQQAQSFGAVICRMAPDLLEIIPLLQVLFVAFGIGMAATGINHYRSTTMTQDTSRMHTGRGITHIAAGGLMISLPMTMGWVVDSLFGGPPNPIGDIVGFSGACTAGATNGGGLALDALLKSFVGNIKGPILWTCSAACFGLGTINILRGLHKAAIHGAPEKNVTLAGINAQIWGGGCLVALGQSLDAITGSLFGGSALGISSASAIDNISILSNFPGTALAPFKTAVAAAFDFFRLVCVIGFCRGLVICKRVVEGVGGQQTMGQGIVHMVAGAMGVNLPYFLQAVQTTFGV